MTTKRAAIVGVAAVAALLSASIAAPEAQGITKPNTVTPIQGDISQANAGGSTLFMGFTQITPSMVGYVGLWPVAFNSTQYGNLAANDMAWY